MTSWSETLLASASRRVPGLEFNAVCFALRGALESEFGHSMLYEVQLDTTVDGPTFAEKVLPGLQDHLHSKKLSPNGSSGLMTWVWHDEHAHLFLGPEFIRLLQALKGEAAVLLLPPSR